MCWPVAPGHETVQPGIRRPAISGWERGVAGRPRGRRRRDAAGAGLCGQERIVQAGRSRALQRARPGRRRPRLSSAQGAPTRIGSDPLPSPWRSWTASGRQLVAEGLAAPAAVTLFRRIHALHGRGRDAIPCMALRRQTASGRDGRSLPTQAQLLLQAACDTHHDPEGRDGRGSLTPACRFLPGSLRQSAHQDLPAENPSSPRSSVIGRTSGKVTITEVHPQTYVASTSAREGVRTVPPCGTGDPVALRRPSPRSRPNCTGARSRRRCGSGRGREPRGRLGPSPFRPSLPPVRLPAAPWLELGPRRRGRSP